MLYIIVSVQGYSNSTITVVILHVIFFSENKYYQLAS